MSGKFSQVVGFLIIVALCIVSVHLLHAKRGKVSAMVLDYSGDVLVQVVEDDYWDSAEIGMSLYSNSTVKTDYDSTCDLSLHKFFNSFVSIDENMQVNIGDLMNGVIKIKRGKITAYMRDMPNDIEFSVSCPFGAGIIRGSGAVFNVSKTQMTIQAYEGDVFALGSGQNSDPFSEKKIPAGYSAVINKGGNIEDFVPISEQDKKAWLDWKNKMTQKAKESEDTGFDDVNIEEKMDDIEKTIDRMDDRQMERMPEREAPERREERPRQEIQRDTFSTGQDRS